MINKIYKDDKYLKYYQYGLVHIFRNQGTKMDEDHLLYLCSGRVLIYDVNRSLSTAAGPKEITNTRSIKFSGSKLSAWIDDSMVLPATDNEITLYKMLYAVHSIMYPNHIYSGSGALDDVYELSWKTVGEYADQLDNSTGVNNLIDTSNDTHHDNVSYRVLKH